MAQRKKAMPSGETSIANTEQKEAKQMGMAAGDMSGRILWLGLGDLYRKCAHALQQFIAQGVEIHGVDINPQAVGIEALQPTDFYNATDQSDMKRLITAARRQPFDLVYVATYPELHLFDAFKYQNFTRNIIIAKPQDAIEHLGMLNTIMDPKYRRSFESFVNKTIIHDHYRNKPSLGALCLLLGDLHARYGFIEEVRVFLVEHKSINEEWHRRAALECGMIFDLGVHNVAVVQELVPQKLRWTRNGEEFERRGRRIEVMACARARSTAAILGNQEAETFAAIDLSITEIIYHQPSDFTFERTFPALLVAGKGCSVDGGVERDLKAVEIKFEGTSIRLNLDTHTIVGGDVEAILESHQVQVDRSQRGINAPLCQLLQKDLDPTAFSHEVALFQSFEDAWENTQVLVRAHSHPLARKRLLQYTVGIPCHDLIG